MQESQHGMAPAFQKLGKLGRYGHVAHAALGLWGLAVGSALCDSDGLHHVDDPLVTVVVAPTEPAHLSLPHARVHGYRRRSNEG